MPESKESGSKRRLEYISYLEADLSRRDSRQQFLWAIAGAIIAATWFMWTQVSKTSEILVAGGILGLGFFLVVGPPVVQRVQQNIRPSIIGANDIYDAVILKRFYEKFRMPLGTRMAFYVEGLSLLLQGVAAIAIAVPWWGERNPIGFLADTSVFGGVLSVVLSIPPMAQLVVPSKWFAKILGAIAAFQYRQSRGLSEVDARRHHIYRELQEGSAPLEFVNLNDAAFVTGTLKVGNMTSHIVSASSIITSILFASMLEALHGANTLVGAAAIGVAAALGLIVVRLIMLLMNEFVREYHEQLLYWLLIGSVSAKKFTYSMITIHALSDNNIRPRMRLDALWDDLDIDSLILRDEREKRK